MINIEHIMTKQDTLFSPERLYVQGETGSSVGTPKTLSPASTPVGVENVALPDREDTRQHEKNRVA